MLTQGSQICHSRLHGRRTLDHLRQKHLSGLEAAPHLLHRIHQRAVDYNRRAARLGHSLVEAGDEAGCVAGNQRGDILSEGVRVSVAATCASDTFLSE